MLVLFTYEINTDLFRELYNISIHFLNIIYKISYKIIFLINNRAQTVQLNCFI